MSKRQVKKKGRKAKKKENKLYYLGDGERLLFSYHKKREHIRKSHVMSIDYARKQHENYWDGWTKGYPNRLRLRTLLNCLTSKKEESN